MADTEPSNALIHVNLALAKYPVKGPDMASFWDREQEVNNQARTYVGFISEIEISDRFSVFPEPHILNASRWNNIADLKNFVYSGRHSDALKNRKQWFTEHNHPKYTLFWGPDKDIYSEQSLSQKLFTYAKLGATIEAFDFKNYFPMPGI